MVHQRMTHLEQGLLRQYRGCGGGTPSLPLAAKRAYVSAKRACTVVSRARARIGFCKVRSAPSAAAACRKLSRPVSPPPDIAIILGGEAIARSSLIVSKPSCSG